MKCVCGGFILAQFLMAISFILLASGTESPIGRSF